MDSLLKKCTEAYDKAPLMAKVHTKAFMDPMLELMKGVVENFQETRVVILAMKGQTKLPHISDGEKGAAKWPFPGG